MSDRTMTHQTASAGLPSHSLLLEPRADIFERDARTIARTHYGLRGELSRLPGERDDNFRIQAREADVVMKIAHARENPVVADFQTAILQHLAHGAVQVPRVVHTSAGRMHELIEDGPGAGRGVRMCTFLPGASLRSTRLSGALGRQLGHTMAELDNSLAGFDHAGAHIALLWDLQRPDAIRALLTDGGDLPGASLLLAQLDAFSSDAALALAGLPCQVVHNDLNLDNVVIGPGTNDVGVLDFGDAIWAPRVVDLAIAASYHVAHRSEDDLLGHALSIIVGYHAHAPLTEGEIGLLYDLIVVRVVNAITIAQWRAKRLPNNRDYVLRNTTKAWSRLRRLLSTERAAVTDEIARAVQ